MDPEDGAVSSERGGLEGWRASAREEERERERERERMKKWEVQREGDVSVTCARTPGAVGAVGRSAETRRTEVWRR